MARKRASVTPALPLPRLEPAREWTVDPPAATNAPRWRSPRAIPLLGGPIPAGDVLIETQRNGDRVNLVSLGGRRVCDYPLAKLEPAT